MATEDGITKYPVIQELQSHPQRYTFFQAVDLLESYMQGQQTQSDIVDVGFFGPTAFESMRFRPHASLGFPSADLKKIDLLTTPQGSKFRMEVNFMGLYGTTSPLPAFYTESIIGDSENESNRRDFLDVFHHRAISLVYRVSGKYLLTNRIKPGLKDEVSNWLFSLIGFRGLMELEQLPLKRPNRLLANLGLLATQNRSAAMVAKIISHYFGGIAVNIEEFIERNVDISPQQRSYLGRSNTTLGEDLTIGASLKDRAGKFRLWLGPLEFSRFSDFLPSRDEFEELVCLTRYLLQDPLAFDVGLVLDSQHTPQLNLRADNPCQLGWSAWLGKPPEDEKHIIIGRNLT
ncbi:MAG: type VI secretion system protein ImpH [Paraglaciecola sp.]|jgi:type VI secretion system protein ImpH